MDKVQQILDILYEHGFTDNDIINWLDVLDEGEVIQVDFKERKIICAPPINQDDKKTNVKS